MVQRILKVMGRTDLQPRILSEVEGEIPEQSLDCSKAKERLGWTSTRSLDEGLRETVAWYAARLEGKRTG